MMRTILILLGFLLLLIHQYILPISVPVQFYIFIVGIVLIGIPHGAADFLVATQTAGQTKRTFSKFLFFITYLGRLLLFAALLWFSPIAGVLLFIVFAAYHFGETDLHKFTTDTTAGKIFVISYGLVILGIILLHHFEEVKPLLLLIDPELKYKEVVAGIQEHRYTILSCVGIFFYCCTFFYFSTAKENRYHPEGFLIQLVCILFILYFLPLVLGFTFYFIIWHSVLSLSNIIKYLRKDDSLASSKIAKQISAYSILAMAGIGIVGFSGFMFINNDTMILYILLGLSVLTAPHMQIMHDMYNTMRAKNKDSLEV